MRLDLFVVALLVGGVVVPIDQVHVCGDFLFYLVGYGQMVHIIRAAADEPEEHIAPHDQLEAVCCGNLGDARQMLHQQLASVLEAVQVLVFSASEHVRFVHADVDRPRTERILERLKDVLQQPVGFVVSGQQDVVAVADVAVHRPAENGVEVRQRLDAGDQLHTLLRRIVVKLAQLGLRIAAAHIAEIRLVVDLVGVLCVQHQGVVAHAGGDVDPPLDRRCVHHRVSGAVDHRAESAKSRFHISNIPPVE